MAAACANAGGCVNGVEWRSDAFNFTVLDITLQTHDALNVNLDD
jgi:hypothetical protein